VLSIAGFIRDENVQDPRLRFRWDEWGDALFSAPVDETVAGIFQNLSHRANVAFSCTTAEWIVYRFANLIDATEPLQCLEAAWAQQIDFRYSSDWRLGDNWEGPAKGPVRMALDQVSLAIEKERDYLDPSSSSAQLDKYARYLLTEPEPYRRWSRLIAHRFAKLYSLNPEDKLGDVVPREGIDPDIDFDPKLTDQLVNDYLRRVNFSQNPLLNTPDMMLEDGFEGIPYVFDIAEDRRQRLDW